MHKLVWLRDTSPSAGRSRGLNQRPSGYLCVGLPVCVHGLTGVCVDLPACDWAYRCVCAGLPVCVRGLTGVCAWAHRRVRGLTGVAVVQPDAVAVVFTITPHGVVGEVALRHLEVGVDYDLRRGADAEVSGTQNQTSEIRAPGLVPDGTRTGPGPVLVSDGTSTGPVPVLVPDGTSTGEDHGYNNTAITLY